MDTNRSGAWWWPLSGLALVLIGVIGVIVIGESPSPPDDSAREIIRYYQDNEGTEQLGISLGMVTCGLMVHFGAVVRNALRAAQPDSAGDLAPLIAFAGTVIFAVGIAIDCTITATLVEAADDITPAGVQALSALYANDYIPFAVGIMLFLLGTGVSVIRHGLMPKPFGWVLVLLGVLAPTPIGFVSFLGGLLMIAAISIRLTLLARKTAGTGPAVAA